MKKNLGKSVTSYQLQVLFHQGQQHYLHTHNIRNTYIAILSSNNIHTQQHQHLHTIAATCHTVMDTYKIKNDNIYNITATLTFTK